MPGFSGLSYNLTYGQTVHSTEVIEKFNIINIQIVYSLIIFCKKLYSLGYKPKYEQSYTHDWLTEWVKIWKLVKRGAKGSFLELWLHVVIVVVIICSVTLWNIDTELNLSNVNIFNIEIIFIKQSKFYNLLVLDDIRKTVCDWWSNTFIL